jgi:hypothetical protein
VDSLPQLVEALQYQHAEETTMVQDHSASKSKSSSKPADDSKHNDIHTFDFKGYLEIVFDIQVIRSLLFEQCYWLITSIDFVCPISDHLILVDLYLVISNRLADNLDISITFNRPLLRFSRALTVQYYSTSPHL